jgi:hypothetical protein
MDMGDNDNDKEEAQDDAADEPFFDSARWHTVIVDFSRCELLEVDQGALIAIRRRI